MARVPRCGHPSPNLDAAINWLATWPGSPQPRRKGSTVLKAPEPLIFDSSSTAECREAHGVRVAFVKLTLGPSSKDTRKLIEWLQKVEVWQKEGLVKPSLDIHALALVGINALVDEATGFQTTRFKDKKALSKMYEKAKKGKAGS